MWEEKKKEPRPSSKEDGREGRKGQQLNRRQDQFSVDGSATCMATDVAELLVSDGLIKREIYENKMRSDK